MGDYPFHVDPRNAADHGSELAIVSRFRSRMKILAPRVRLVAIPNGGQRTAYAAMKAKQEGMSAGFPDMEARWANGGQALLEFKARDGSLSQAQIDWLTWLHANGHPCGVFRHPETAIEFLRRLGAPFLNYSMLGAA